MDKKILALLREKPEKGLEKLMEEYSGMVYAIIYNKLNHLFSREDIEECTSMVFYEAYENRNAIDPAKGSLKAYLAVMAKRRAIDLLRKNARHFANVVPLDTYDADNSIVNAAEEMDAETKDMLITAVKALGEPDSEIFIRKYYFGQSSRKISEILGIKQNTIDKKVSRGLEKLRILLGKSENNLKRKDI
ncbi:MAG TPA: sigma-70 family RNA polymerase sigma factor [Ruminiclostridium sp.]|nr:sigma-70 family RNA polymerase sigma factor [Ruminiclostridium sp.]